tara:strand:- start:1733 stop:1915 length:183 start_codon:yes stop_codon:yes gene_type:complete
MQYLKLRKYMVMVDDADVDIMRQIIEEMDGTLNTLPVENMTIKNVFQQIINEAETNQQGN